MANHEVAAPIIWVGDTEPVTTNTEAFWLDTATVPATAVPGVEYPATLTADWTAGEASFFVNGSTVTLRLTDATSGPGVPAGTESQVCVLPAEVPAPFNSLRMFSYFGTGGGYDNPCYLEVRAGGVWVGSFTSRAMSAGKAITDTFTWAI